MDAFDLKILQTLIANGRESHEAIGKALNLSRPAVHQRVKKLEAAGIIKRYQAIVDWSKLGQIINAIIYLKINATMLKHIISDIFKITVADTYLEGCHRLAGEWCIMLKIRSASTQNLTNYIDELLKINGVAGTSTTFILSTILQNGSANIASV
ncbi:MAG: Lrp/AsnC family transcriptional regulator [Oscillospiraceae bacterium]